MSLKLKPLLCLLTGISSAILLFSFSNPQDGGFVLKGSLTGISSGTAYLMHTYNNQTLTDSAVIKEGAFEFKGKSPEPLLYTLKVSGSKQQKVFFIENAAMQMKGTVDSLYKATVTGSATGELYASFYAVAWKPVTDRAGKIYKRMDIAEDHGKKKMDSVTRKQFDQEFAALSLYNDTIVHAFVKQHLNSVASAVIIEDRYIDYPYPDQANELYKLLNPAVQNSTYGKQVKAALDLDAKTGIGRMAADFTQPDTLGKPVSLHSFKGKYVLVDFWASWCGPCRKENPNVVKAYQKYHPKGFEILSVSLDNKKEAWLKAIHTDGLNWYHVSDLKGWNNAAAATYGVKSVPSSYLIDRDGKILARGLRGEDLERKLAQLMK